MVPADTVKDNRGRAFQDGDFVVAHTEYDFFGPKIGFDIFRFEKGFIVEHWDNTQELNKDEKLEIAKITDLNKTKENKQLIQKMIDKKVLEGKYLKNHKILAQGNFVLAINELEKNNQKSSLYELFDIKDSKIINTWKIEEVIPPISQWQNSNGKF